VKPLHPSAGQGTFLDPTKRQGAIQTPGNIQKSAPLTGLQKPLITGQGKGGASPSIPTEPLIELPPAGTAAAKSTQLLELRDTLKNIASKLPPGEARSTYERAAKAAEQVAKMSAVGTPVRFAIKKDKNRPEKLEGFIERTIGGPEGKRTAETLFRPKDKAIRPFRIPTADVDGLRSGARISLELEKTEQGTQSFVARFTDSEYAASFVGTVKVEDGKAYAVGLESAPVYAKVPLDDSAKALVGKEVIVNVENAETPGRTGKVASVVGAPDDVASKILESALQYGASATFSAQAMAEVKLIQEQPIVGKDFRHLPFVTMDNVDSMDLDQAMCIKKRADGGYDLHYAIADVAYFVKEGSALDREAKRRSETSYLEGRALGMLPKELSEDKISLLPNVDRRAFIVTVSMDKNGEVTGRSFDRGVVQSRAKLAYSGVQSWFDGGKKGELAGKDFTETLELLKDVGKLRVDMARKRGVVPSDADERHLALDRQTGKVVVAHESRYMTEKWNEQISLLANEAVGRELREAGLKALFRTHPEATAERLDAFREIVAGLGVPWPPNQSMATFIEGLDPKDPRTMVIQIQAKRVNQPAFYTPEPQAGHAGLKLQDYAHFTAPMRRYTDVIVARVLAAKVEGQEIPYQDEDDHTLNQVAFLMDQARERSSNIAVASDKILAAAYFKDRQGQSFEGQIIGARPGKIQVALDDGPPVYANISTVDASGKLQNESYLASGGSELIAGDIHFKLAESVKLKLTTMNGRPMFVPAVIAAASS